MSEEKQSTDALVREIVPDLYAEKLKDKELVKKLHEQNEEFKLHFSVFHMILAITFGILVCFALIYLAAINAPVWVTFIFVVVFLVVVSLLLTQVKQFELMWKYMQLGKKKQIEQKQHTEEGKDPNSQS